MDRASCAECDCVVWRAERRADFDAAFDALGDAAFNVLDGQALGLGISHRDMFREKVEILNRKYNTAFNAPASEVAVDDPAAHGRHGIDKQARLAMS